MKRKSWVLVVLVWMTVGSAQAQLNRVFEDLFNQILVEDLLLSPGNHGSHFIEAATLANETLTPSLNSLVASNISSIPLSSTSVGVTFDFSSGQPVPIRESLGPIFAETGSTLGRKRLNFGVNFTNLTMDQFRGVSTEAMRFTFTHEDVTNDGTLGESANESDTIDIFLNLDVDASISALYATYGLTDNFDVGIAVPFVDIQVEGNAMAVIDSFTFANLALANHNFGSDPTNPDLVNIVPYGGSASGIGDVSLRFKYSFLRTADVQLAFLLDVRLPTGDENDFLGSGSENIRISEILSKKIGNVTAHFNVNYEMRKAQLDSDELEVYLGFDQKLGEGLTWAVDLLGEFDVDDNESISLFPGSTTIVDHVGDGRFVRNVDLSNIPEQTNDDTINISLGARYAPSDNWIFLANILVPLDDSGLRSDITPTIGFSGNF